MMPANYTIQEAATAPANELPPTVNERLSMLYRRRRISPHKRRLLGYLVSNPGALTHEIASQARVSYPPSPIAQLNRDLPSVGLHIKRIRPDNNRAATCRWRLEKCDQCSGAAMCISRSTCGPLKGVR